VPVVTTVNDWLVFQNAPGPERTSVGWVPVPASPPVPLLLLELLLPVVPLPLLEALVVEPPLPLEPPVPPPEQAPLLQVSPAPHIVQLEPQWAASVLELQAPSLHFVLPGGQDPAHWLLEQTWPLAHMVQLDPQCVVFDETHALLH
jgi:hypothetical protein